MTSVWTALATEATVAFLVVGTGTAWFRAKLKKSRPGTAPTVMVAGAE
jgi:hypothetical protein